MTMSIQDIRTAIDGVPRVRFNQLPTPIQRAERLSKELGVDLWIKRDDLAEVFGGNKSRTLEFRLADALSRQPDPLVLAVEGISNTAPATAMICNRLGVPLVLVLRSKPPTTLQGNLLLDHLFGLEIHRVDGSGLAASDPFVDELVASYEDAGRNPVVLNRVPSFFGYGPPVAYLEAFLEIDEAMTAESARAEAVYMCSSGKSQAGLLAGASLLGRECRVVGVSPSPPKASPTPGILGAVAKLADLLGIEIAVDPGAVFNDTQHVGSGYGSPTEAAIAAIRLTANREGVLLCPDRTGKAMAALLDDIETGVVRKGQTVVFVHTGGVANLFGHARSFHESANLPW